MDIARKIKGLFGSLHTRIIHELTANPDMTVQTLLDKLTGLPLHVVEEQ